MQLFFQTLFNKTTAIILLIAAVILLCPVNPLSASATVACNATTDMAQGHTNNSASTACPPAHSEMGNHAMNSVLPALNALASLFFAAVVGFIIFFQKSLFWFIESYLTKLNRCRHRYRVVIKPQLEKIFLRWLNLLGNTIAFSI